MIELAFWAGLAFVVLTYCGYPLFIYLLSKLRPVHAADPASVRHWPPVTVICAVHNEQHRVAAKVASLREQTYPRERMQILFVSDGSTDHTVQNLRALEGVEVIEYAQRRGKPHALNLAVQAARGDVLVFTDVRQALEPNALQFLVAQLQDPKIGAASGELTHQDAKTRQAQNIGLYWRYEKWIRKSESRWYSTIGSTGALYAIRRSDYTVLAEDTLLDDFEVPMHIVRAGKRAILDERAVMFDELQQDVAGEKSRKVRTLKGNFQSFARNLWLFSPRQNPVFLQFLCHKVFRLLVPYALLVSFVASWLLLAQPFYAVMAGLQTAGYIVAFCGGRIPAVRELPGVSVLVVFMELNLAAVQAGVAYFTQPVSARWDKT
jgi:cellulose synthase/poly-beta-1,6-N-acetylglucosamine synthase-like glycosyltransferase